MKHRPWKMPPPAISETAKYYMFFFLKAILHTLTKNVFCACPGTKAELFNQKITGL